MWDLGNFWGEGKSTPMSSYLGVMHEIHVLLVDHDADGLMSTSKMLEMCQYRVSVVELASAAITMLSNGKVKIDFVLANVNSPDLHGFKLLQLAVNMSIPIILMSVDDNALIAMRAIENGAYLYIKKPVTIELVRCLWQHVVREKTRMRRERQAVAAVPNYNNVRGGIEFREVNGNRVEDNMMMMNDARGKSKKSYFNGIRKDVDEEYDSDNTTSQGRVRRKVCTEWTQDLHEKFMNAVEQLGEGRCFPKEILDLMNVPGLTRMQVASHLQKCRNDNWRSPDERKSTNGSGQSEGGGSSQQKLRRFGSMPRAGRAPSSGGGSKSGRSESDHHHHNQMGNDIGVVENNIGMNEGQMMAANTNAAVNYTHQQQYGTVLVPHSAALGINPRHPAALADDYNYYYPEMDCLMQQQQNNNNYAVPRAMEHPHLSNVYAHDQQNSNATSMDNRSPWTGGSDQNSTFGSDHSEARGH